MSDISFMKMFLKFFIENYDLEKLISLSIMQDLTILARSPKQNKTSIQFVLKVAAAMFI